MILDLYLLDIISTKNLDTTFVDKELEVVAKLAQT